jgi:phosphoserine phosphatase RsbU/P
MRDARDGPSHPRQDEQFEGERELKNRALDVALEGIVITDFRHPDNPLIYVNEGFERLTGYSVAEVLGSNCRFLQGPDTDPQAAEEIRAAVRERRACRVEILNHRQDGTPFWNRLSITPVKDASGEVTHFIGVQSDITERRRAEEALRAANEELARANQRMRDSLEAAGRVQRAFLPTNLPHLPDLRFAWGFRPSETLAGDSLGVVRLNDTHVALYVLDVSGHGVRAALLSVTLSRLLSAQTERSLTLGPGRVGEPGRPVLAPAVVAAALNREFPMDGNTREYFTIAYAVLDLSVLELTFACAGHPLPVLLEPGATACPVGSGNVPIGFFEAATFDDQRMRLKPGMRFFLYSDGVTEQEDAQGRCFGSDRLMVAMDATRDQPLDAAVAAILDAVQSWGGGSPADDLSLLAMEVTAQPD